MRDVPFPLYRMHEIERRPKDFRLLERVPFCSIIENPRIGLPVCLNEIAGDEVSLVILDTETTGFDAAANEMIEIGIVRCSYSPSHGVVTSIDDIYSGLESPTIAPIPADITAITGITNEDVEGCSFDDDRVHSLLVDGDPLVIAHHAGFDRPFVENRFKGVEHCRWVCSIKDIDWKARGFESNKLEYLLLNTGYFYHGHRATTDCLAVLWLLAENPSALDDALAASIRLTCVVRAFGAPFEIKDSLKNTDFTWDDGSTNHPKHWWKSVSETELDDLREWLNSLSGYSAEKAEYTSLTARQRYKQNPA
ncbi:3'-5' exonuclease [Marinobacterium sp. BA1]|uniref:3'-5' exonuclease n=1 Tax=Marinobacterium sp. BA1 TaxID=3138931 RepID=UPI0032E6BF93